MKTAAQRALAARQWPRLMILTFALSCGCAASHAQVAEELSNKTSTAHTRAHSSNIASETEQIGTFGESRTPGVIQFRSPELRPFEPDNVKLLPESYAPRSEEKYEDYHSVQNRRADDLPADGSTPKKEKFHWKPALIQSGIFLGIQHGFRLTQKKTKDELRGPFFGDWANSVRNLRGWADGDNLFINYVAHSMQGSATGRIFVNNSDNARKQEFGKAKAYWISRAKALAWSAAWSTQFELGPLSEASIGNVGIYNDYGPSQMSWGDLIVTPVIGTGFLVGEDAIDKYILKNWLERKSNHKVNKRIKLLRSILTPTTSFANLLRGKPPWKRDNR